MTSAVAAPSRTFSIERPAVALAALIASPAVAIFIATNLANAGNLAFNMVFSRLLTPAAFHDLAVVLTLKLAVLSIFGAVQMAVSQISARGGEAEPALVGLHRMAVVSFVTLFLFVPFLLPVAFSDAVARALGLGDTRLLAVLLFFLPVAAPLSIARGAAFGRSAIGGMVISANLEMLVRLIGALAAWSFGLDLPGIVAALGLSLVAGWYPVRRQVRRCAVAHTGAGAGQNQNKPSLTVMKRLAARITWLALPFALLQLAQVGHLDGDLLISAAALDDGAEVTLIAGLTLIQRIQFYACFGLAGVLLPAVTAAALGGGSVLRPAVPIAALVLGAGAVLVLAAYLAPELVITLVAGSGFAGAAPALLPAVIAAFAFTGTYLAATLLAGLGDRSGVALVIISLPFVIAALWLSGGAGGLQAMMMTKALAQTMLFALVLIHLAQVLLKRHLSAVN